MSLLGELGRRLSILRLAFSGVVCALASAEHLGDEIRAEQYLSDEYFVGLHVLHYVQGRGRLRVYPGGQRPEAAADVMPERAADAATPSAGTRGLAPVGLVEVDCAGWATMDEVRSHLEVLLRIPPREPLQQPWAIFDALGRRLDDVVSLKRARVAFLLGIGSWMWPAVRIGFRQVVHGVSGDTPVTLETLSLRPVIFRVRAFLSADEAVKVRQLGEEQVMTPSRVAKGAQKRESGELPRLRTSQTAWVSNTASPLIGELDERVAKLTRVPSAHNENLQVLRYEDGQYYRAHTDWSKLELKQGLRDLWLKHHFGHQDRLATVFWYLNDVPNGGETNFPKFGQPVCGPLEQLGQAGNRKCSEAPERGTNSCNDGLSVKPELGTVLLWYNFHPSGRGDANALHAGCPVGANQTKWTANKWVLIKPRSAAKVDWNESHPALQRHSWNESADDASQRGRGHASGLKCTALFANEAAVTAEVLYLRANGSRKALGSVAPRASKRFKSSEGHRFVMAVGSEDSNAVACTGGHARFVLLPGLSLLKQEPRVEL